jgi:hypothetical protein
MHRVVVALVIAAAVALGGGAASQEPTPENVAYGFSVAFAPRPADGKEYVCLIEVIDVHTGDLVAAPKIAAQLGQSATVTIGSNGEEKLEFEVSLDEAGRHATFEGRVSRAGRLQTLQKMTLSVGASGAL